MLFKGSMALIILVQLSNIVGAKLLQGRSPNSDGCRLIDAMRPTQSIVYEGKSETKIRLRLRNNSSCAIMVETDDHFPTQLKKLPQGGATIEHVLDPRDGLRLPLHYLIQNRRRGEALKRAYGWGDSVFTYEIPAGQSIVFDVPATHFKRGSDIAVPFAYSWEGSRSIASGVGGVNHQVYFLVDDLPSAALGDSHR